MFMYDDGAGNRLTLYARVDHAGTGETGFQFFRQGDLMAFAWVDRDLCYVVTGTIDRPRLLAVAQAVYHQLSPGDREP
jgi:anti-sigma factor RsiW